jgi:hypothetical protein
MDTTATTPTGVDVPAVVLEVLVREGQALTPSQVRSQLRKHGLDVEEVRRTLDALASQGKVHAWPAYRSKTPRYAVQPMDAAAQDVFVRLLDEEAFTRSELIGAVRREIGGLEQAQAEQMLEQLLSEGRVRKLPPRLGGTTNLLGTPNPRSYLQPLFATLGRSLARLLPALESEGVSRREVLEEARNLWEEALRQAESDEGAETDPDPRAEAEDDGGEEEAGLQTPPPPTSMAAPETPRTHATPAHPREARASTPHAPSSPAHRHEPSRSAEDEEFEPR